MSDFRYLLATAALEAREYIRTSPDVQTFGTDYLTSLAQRMESASAIENVHDLELVIDAIARSVIDSGPLTPEFAPSFMQAFDTLQRRRKIGTRR